MFKNQNNKKKTTKKKKKKKKFVKDIKVTTPHHS